ncbi:MAG: hypothetical protein QME42_00580 [bacterium]|nr:hypothetical protein [bacterium]
MKTVKNSKELSNVDIVVYVIFKLGGWEKKIHTEDIAMECFKLSNERFSWRLPKYREYPDKEIVRVTLKNLKNAKDPKYGQFITGRAGVESSGKEVDGWMLTPKGTKWITRNYRRIEDALKIPNKDLRRPHIQRIIQKFEREKCYQKYLQEGSVKNISQYEFTDMLLCRPDAYPETIRKKFDQLKTQAEITQKKSIISFLDACEEAFKDLMN